jgi:hypothetical protein
MVQCRIIFVALMTKPSHDAQMNTTTKDRLLAEIEAYLMRTGTAETTFGLAVSGDGALVRRIREATNGPGAARVDAARRVIFQHPDGIHGPKEAASIRRQSVDEKRKVKR